MNLERLRKLCLSLPGRTEHIQWGDDLVFKVGGRMFCVAATSSTPSHDVAVSFKCDDETFAELCERDGIIPAPYLAKAKWVGLQRFNALEDREYKELVPRAYELVRAKLTKKAQASLAEAARKRTALDGTAGLKTGRSRTTSRRPARRASGKRSSRR